MPDGYPAAQTGRRPCDSANGSIPDYSVTGYLHPDDREARREALRPLVERHADSCTATLRLIHRDGSLRWWTWRCARSWTTTTA